MGWIGSLIIGGIAGWLAGTLLKGGGYGIIANVIIGVIGAFIGSLVFSILGFAVTNIIGQLVAATVGAIILILVLRAIKKK